MTEAPLIDRELVDAFRRLSREGLAGPDHRSQARARRAMLAAVAARPKHARFFDVLHRSMQPRSLIAEFGVLAVAALFALGWSAPAGTLFHSVRLAREAITRSFPGENRLDVDLGFAEQSLADAARNQARPDSLAEARLFLDDARSLLPVNENDPSWLRWQADENQLAALSAPPTAQVSTHSSVATRRTTTARPTQGASTEDRSSSEGEGDRQWPRPSGSPRPSPSPSPSASTSPSPQPSPQPSPSPSPTEH
jgi:hypothetical protein